MFAIIFSFVLAAACIISIKYKSFISFFFPVVLFLPDYYGVDLSYGLPLVTGARIFFIILYCYVFILYRKEIVQSSKNIRPDLIFVLICSYFLLRIISNLYHVRAYSGSIKNVFLIVFEQLLLVAVFSLISLSDKQRNSIVEAIVYASAVMYILGVAESLTGYRLATLLYTVKRPMVDEYYERLGFLRSTVSMALPNLYGNFCTLTMPLIMYCFHRTRKKIFFAIAFLNLMACVHSGTRSSLIFIIAILFLGIFAHIKNRSNLLSYIKTVALLLVTTVLVMSLVSIFSTRLRYLYVGTGKSILNEVGFDFDLNEGAPKGVKGYGANQDGALSRTAQFSGFVYVAQQNPVFGLGPDAQDRGLIKYYIKEKWRAFRTYDVGFVQIFGDEGAVGLLGYFALFIGAYIALFSKKYKTDHEIKPYLILGVTSYLICMLSSSNMFSFLFVYIVLTLSLPKASA